jgi:hypothetical protein
MNLADFTSSMLPEIEGELLLHPGVKDAAVIGAPHPTWGEVGVAFLVPRSYPPPAGEELATFLAARLAKYKIPKEFVFVDSLPRTPYGKVVKGELAACYARSREPGTGHRGAEDLSQVRTFTGSNLSAEAREVSCACRYCESHRYAPRSLRPLGCATAPRRSCGSSWSAGPSSRSWTRRRPLSTCAGRRSGGEGDYRDCGQRLTCRHGIASRDESDRRYDIHRTYAVRTTRAPS